MPIKKLRIWLSLQYRSIGLKQGSGQLASQFGKGGATPKTVSVLPDGFDRLLCIGAVALLSALVIALFKGRAEWGQLPGTVWVHIATIATALILTPVMLTRRRGDPLHRQLGWVWVISMFLTALISLDIRLINRGGFSVIHILSVWTLIQVTVIIWSARNHNVAQHKSAVRGMVLGALLIAGFFTFPFNRLLGQWLFG
jgi:uncharacterized membrane protein